MTRTALALAALAAAGLIAEAGVAPPVPRLPAAALQQLKSDEPSAEPADPAKLAERIQQNTKAAADRLADQDPGEETRKRQEQALKDIDELLKQQSQSPMGGGGSQGEQNKDQSNQQQNQQNQGGGGGGGGGMPKSGGKAGGGGQQSQKQGSWRDRRGQGQQQAGSDQKQPAGGQQQEKQPAGQQQTQQAGANDPKNAGGTPGGGGTKAAPALPLDEAITKQVWGHLPERLRQQMSQYYKEQFMPKYSDMLRQYYAALAEREKKK